MACYFIKAYLPREAEDEYLVRTVLPLVRRVGRTPGFGYFFFVRYQDPNFHLRLRFFGDPLCLSRSNRERIRAESRASVLSAPIQSARYYPEKKRYGGERGVRVAEKIFAASSDVVLEYLANGRLRRTMSRTEFALATCESLLDGIGMKQKARRLFFQPYADGASPEALAGFAPIYTRVRKIVETAVLAPGTGAGVRSATFRILDGKFHVRLRESAKDVKNISQTEKIPMHELASSYLHMHLNRLGIFGDSEKVVRTLRAMYCHDFL